MLDPVEAAARSIAKDCGYEAAFAPRSAAAPYSGALMNPDYWLRIARNALAASIAAALEMREAEQTNRQEER